MKHKSSKVEMPLDFIPSKPQIAIIKVWEEYDLDSVMGELPYWLYAALSHKMTAYEDVDSRRSLIEFYDPFTFLVEAMFFYSRQIDVERAKRMEQADEETRAFQATINLPRRLSMEGVARPLLVVKSFRKCFEIGYIRRELSDLLEAVIGYEGIYTRYIDLSTAIHFQSCLLTLAEAAYLL